MEITTVQSPCHLCACASMIMITKNNGKGTMVDIVENWKDYNISYQNRKDGFVQFLSLVLSFTFFRVRRAPRIRMSCCMRRNFFLVYFKVTFLCAAWFSNFEMLITSRF